MNDRTMAERIARGVAALGGRAYLVGGCVRDRVLGRESKDIDIEVHGIRPDQLENVLDSLGTRNAVGQSFGIYQLKGYTLDIAMPRRAGVRGAGHDDFGALVDPEAGTYEAARRRDFTMNALMEDVLTGQITDHFHGLADLSRGVLRHVDDDTFREDPLRVFRAAQFAARFGFSVAEETERLCAGTDVTGLPRERVMQEVEKALLKSAKPSVFFETLRRMDKLRPWLSELADTVGVPQSPRVHAEGDVWTHTMMVLDEAAPYRGRVSDPLGFLLAAALHDVGKAVCTEEIGGELHAYRHEVLGLPLAEAFMNRLTGEKRLTAYVLNLVRHHMRPNRAAADHSSVKSTNRMFDESLDPQALICLAVADGQGKIPREPSHEAFLQERLAAYRAIMSRPYIMGRDLAAAGIPPSPRFGEYMAYAHKLRLAGVEKDPALRQVLALAGKNGDRKQDDGQEMNPGSGPS